MEIENKAADKKLMEFKTMSGRTILAIEQDGSVTHYEPMTPAELKAAVDYAIELRLPAAEALMAMIFSSEIARLTKENAELKRGMRSHG